MKRSLPKLTALAAALTVPLVLSACSNAASGSSADTIVLAAQGEVPPLDPQRMTGTIGLRVSDAIYDTLVREDLSKKSTTAAEIQPALAKSWSVSKNGLEYTFTIRDGVTFHDGAKLDAAAVQTNFDRILVKDSKVYSKLAAANMKYLARWIDHTQATDAHTFKVTLSAAFPEFLRLLSDRRMGIISPKTLTTQDDDGVAAHPDGTGPFKAGTIAQGKDIVLTRNDNYWRGKAKVKKLLFTNIADANTMVSALQTGQIDVILSAGADQIAQLKGKNDVTVQYPEPANSYFIRLNTRAQATKNPLVRQALNYAVDRNGIAAATNGQTVPLGGSIPRGNSAWQNGVDGTYTYNPQKAKELLAEAGVKLPLKIKLMAPSEGPGFSQSRNIMSLIQQNFSAIGVKLDVQFVEFTSMVATEASGYTDGLNGSYNGWTTGADSAYWLENMFSPDLLPPTGVNRGWYVNDKLRALFKSARADLNDASRNELYRKAGAMIDADAPWVFLYQDRLPRAFSNHIGGMVEAPSIYIDYTALTKSA